MSSRGRSSAASQLLAQAVEKQRTYDWMAAAHVYRQYLDEMPAEGDWPERSRISEELAKCYSKGAFQAQSRDVFKDRMMLARDSYRELATLYESHGSHALSKRTGVREIYTSFWLLETFSEKREAIRKCIEVADEALQVLEEIDEKALAETQKDLLTYLFYAWQFVQDWQESKDLFERATGVGQDAIARLKRLGGKEDFLESLWFFVPLRYFLGISVLGLAHQKELVEETKKLIVQMRNIADELGTAYALLQSTWTTMMLMYEVEGERSETLRLGQSLISMAQAVKDTHLIGGAYAALVYMVKNSQFVEEDLEKKREFLLKAMEAAPIAMEKLQVVLDWDGLEWLHSNYAECYTALALVEVEVEKKKVYLQKAIEIAKMGMTYESKYSVSHALSKASYFLASIESDSREKLRLLKESLPIRQDTVRGVDRIDPRSNQPAVMRNYLALIKAELSDLEPRHEAKVELLRDAVLDMEKCVEQYGKWAINPSELAVLARYEEWYGDIVLRLLRLTAETDVAKRALDVYHDAISNLTKSEHLSPIATLQWKVAKIHDILGDYKEASEAFGKAAEIYRSASKKFQGSALTFGELASYMEAWSRIETARLHHNDEQYLSAAETYAKAASTLESVKTWNYLAQHYTACSHLEAGEALSRQERLDSSIESFRAALEAFQNAKLDLDRQWSVTSNPHEKTEVERWLEITNGRIKYCTGRIELEEAKVLDKKGDEESSSAKYRSASETFKALREETESDQARREVDALAIFCHAWAKMKEAEAEASPQLYSTAADLFSKAKDVVTRKKARVLAMANSSICKALEYGSQFRLTRDTRLYSQIKSNLESATDYYGQAGLENAAEWTRATGSSFDALVCLADAATERNSERKAELYNLAEKNLRMSARLYGDAGYQRKKEEALRHLKRAKEEKELLLSPIEALADNPAVSGASVVPVTLLREQAIGLERFERANVVGNISLSSKEVGVGSEIVLELELTNVGKTSATLVKLENFAAEGLALNREKIQHRVEDNFIDMKGRSLEYLKTYEVKIPLKTTQKGTFHLHPRILFVDERGNYMSYEFQPASLMVKELGVTGWLKGPK